MTRNKFQQDIAALKHGVDSLGAMAEEAVEDAVSALLLGDERLAHRVLDNDRFVRKFFVDIERFIYELVTLQQPVGTDLRFMFSALTVATNWQRTASLAVLLSRIAAEGCAPDPMMGALLREAATQAILLTKEARWAWREHDYALAAELRVRSYSFDETYRRLSAYPTAAGAEEVRSGFQYLLAGRHLYEIAHNAIAVGDRTCYMLTGDIRALESEIA